MIEFFPDKSSQISDMYALAHLWKLKIKNTFDHSCKLNEHVSEFNDCWFNLFHRFGSILYILILFFV